MATRVKEEKKNPETVKLNNPPTHHQKGFFFLIAEGQEDVSGLSHVLC